MESGILDDLTEGYVYPWSEVTKIHQIRNGIYQRNGRLISLLTDFGRINPCYPDEHGDSTDTILYTGNGRRGDQKFDAQNRALLDAIASKISVPLFNKLAPGRWQFLGFWRVTDSRYILKWNEFNSPLRRTVTQAEVGNAALFLLSDLGSAVTGENLHVDAGYHVVGMKAEDAPDISVVQKPDAS